MMLSIDTIHENPDNARRVEGPFENDDTLRLSMSTVGLIQPLVVTPHPKLKGAWLLKVGHRRLRCAKRLGWEKISAVEMENDGDGYVPERAISAAENMARSSMHPVDQWRAIRDLQDESGYSLERAAAAIGVPKVLAQRMSVLAKIAPPIIEELSKGTELPGSHILRTIATAPIEVQEAAFKRVGRDKSGIHWYEMQTACQTKKIPMTRAIFDPKLIAWDEDFFAEPDADDRFTTKDVAEFMQAQGAALGVLIEKSKGRYVQAEEDQTGSMRAKLPRGWRQDFTPIPKRFAKDDPRKVFAVIVDNGYRLGCVDYVMATPVAESISDSGDQFEAPKPAINKTTLTKLAEMKAEAVRERVLQFKGNGAADMLRVMLMLFTMNNVSAGRLKGSAHNTLAQALVLPDGEQRDDVLEEDLCDMAAWVVREAIEFDHPGSFNGPGKGAEWLAMAIGAEMPRTDTKEILRGVSAERLRDIAAEHAGMTKLMAPGDMRKALTGALPNWRLVDFGAPGPMLRDADDDPEDGIEEAAE